MKTRVISAIVLVLIVLPLYLYGGVPYSIGVFLLGMLGIKEYLDMKENEKELPIFIKLISYLCIPLIILNVEVTKTSILSMDFRIITGLFLILLLPMVIYHEKETYSISDACYVTTGVLFIGLSMSFLITYYNMNRELLLYLLCITVFTDTFALFTGKLIGKNKLLEAISPNKTWEGFIGGAVLGTFVAVMFYKTVINPEVIMPNLIAITLFLSIIGQLGDLFFSAIKRHYSKKDFSNIIPGHGGILDRLDSIIFVMLAFSLFINLL